MFENCSTPQEVKNEYRKIVFRIHPDRHPREEFDRWNAETQVLNAAYLAALRRFDGEVFTGADNRDHKYTYNHDAETALIESVARAIRAKLPDHCRVSIVGTWVWVEGLTAADKQYHAALKATPEEVENGVKGFYFNFKRSAWCWSPPESRSRFNPRYQSLDDIKSAYGSRTVENEKTALANA